MQQIRAIVVSRERERSRDAGTSGTVEPHLKE